MEAIRRGPAAGFGLCFVCPFELRYGPLSALRHHVRPCGCGGGLWLVANQVAGRKKASPATGITVPWLLGLGAHDPRSRLDPDKTPWRAVGKLQVPSISFYQSCTATLVAPATVLTAAHCVFNPRTQRYHLAGSLHFLIGYDGSRYAGHALVANSRPGRL